MSTGMDCTGLQESGNMEGQLRREGLTITHESNGETRHTLRLMPL
jgi:hypothetical protein